jgi:hypothetical protein
VADKPRTVTVHQAVKILNRLLEKDRRAISLLFLNRMACNKALASDPEAQVRTHNRESPPSFSISALGALQALFGIRRKDKYGFIVAVTDEWHSLIERFEVTKKNETVVVALDDGHTTPIVRDRKRRR